MIATKSLATRTRIGRSRRNDLSNPQPASVSSGEPENADKIRKPATAADQLRWSNGGIISVILFLALPFLVYPGDKHGSSYFKFHPLVRHVDLVWSSMIQMGVWPVAAGTFLAAWFIRSNRFEALLHRIQCHGNAKYARDLSVLMKNISKSPWRMSVIITLFFASIMTFNVIIQQVLPLTIWNPFIWLSYRVYLPKDISSALRGACLDMEKHSTSRQPLCLSEQSWNELSSGKLSSRNPDDVLAVQKGLHYLQDKSGGLIIKALARNIADSIPAVRQNMDGLAPFFEDSKKLSLVIFENDSIDGTRELLKRWADEESRYTVDVMSCGKENPNCELGLMDRYDANLLTNSKASGVGKLGEFRQILLEYVMGKEDYNDYSHMIVLDLDLGTSISPLGVLHTLGLENDIAQDYVVASSSSMIWPGTGGSFSPPYDFSAFRPKKTIENQKIRALHRWYCQLRPAGDRWRNLCDAASPMQLFMIQSANDITNNHGHAYEVESAFNGLTMYPLDLIRKAGTRARYDSGDDGQRCEHIGFHMSLQDHMFVNPKWSMNLKPNRPGGPSGLQALKAISFVALKYPMLASSLVLSKIVFFYIVVSVSLLFLTVLDKFRRVTKKS